MCLTWYIHLYMYNLVTSEHIPAYSWLQVNIVNYLSGFLQKVVVQLLSCVWLFMTPWTAARQSSLSLAFSRSLPKFMSVESVMPSKPHPLPPSSLFAFSPSQHQDLFNDLAVGIRWLKYWRFSFSISPSSEYSGLMSFRILWFDLLAVQSFFFFFKHLFLMAVL